MHAVLGALARGAGALERRGHGQLGEPVPEVLQEFSLIWFEGSENAFLDVAVAQDIQRWA